MGRPVKGDVVVVTFPFSDLTGSKRRPALVLADAGGGAFLLAQITSQGVRDGAAVALPVDGFVEGGLRVASNVRPNRLFTADEGIVLYTAGRVKGEILARAVEGVRRMLDGT